MAEFGASHSVHLSQDDSDSFFHFRKCQKNKFPIITFSPLRLVFFSHDLIPMDVQEEWRAVSSRDVKKFNAH